ncbi:MAG: hypothetical protein HC887_02030 [Desulfobacteraceae bacterium]|nr:hypothetical protein [Desulfobacteraceae bacterium]
MPPSRSFRFQYTGAGLLDRVIDMRGNFHRYTYLNGTLIQIKKANVEADAPTPWLQISYDSNGRVDQQKTGYNLGTPDSGAFTFSWGSNSLEYRSPTGKGATYQWDAKFRTTGITPMNMSDAQPVNIAYTSDTGANSLLPKTQSDFIGKQYGYVFDGPNLKTVTDPLSQSYQQTYNTTNDMTGF